VIWKIENYAWTRKKYFAWVKLQYCALCFQYQRAFTMRKETKHRTKHTGQI